MKSEEEISKLWGNSHEPMVSIICPAYNHERFIDQTLKGFINQVTDFPFEIILHDDASTDRTASIIADYEKKYPKIIKCIFQKENQFSKGRKITPILLQHAMAKYIAFCEGDDYWTDPYKLKKQIEFLETHPDFSMCCTNFSVIDTDGNIIYNEGWHGRKVKNAVITHKMILESYNPKTLTSVIRRNALPNSWPIEYYASPNGDNFIFAVATIGGDAAYLDAITGCYRKHSDGIWSSKDIDIQYKMQLITCKYLKKYFNNKQDKQAMNQRIIRIGQNLLITYIQKNNLKEIFFLSIKLSLNGFKTLWQAWHKALKTLR